MSELRTLLADYLAMRLSLGARLQYATWCLKQFLAFLAEREARTITTDLALEWALKPQGVQPAYHAVRLAQVRQFARYANAMDPRHEIPPEGLLFGKSSRSQPYIYNASEIADLIQAAQGLCGRIRPLTYATIIGLLSVTGMRRGEVLRLDRDDVDLRRGLITIRNSKFYKSRMVVCHDSTRQVLRGYAVRRDDLWPHPQSPAFFLSDLGTRVGRSMLNTTFAKLTRTTGLRGSGDSRGPRLHDMRHYSGIRLIPDWQQSLAGCGQLRFCFPE